MVPRAKLILACNAMPRFSDINHGLFRRLLLVPFNRRISDEEADRNLAQSLLAELPGIWLWSMRGLRRLIQQNRFTPCSTSDALMATYRSDIDSAEEFAEECLVASATPAVALDSVRLFQLYKCFATQRGRHPVGESEFGRRVLDWSRRRCIPVKKGRASTPTFDGGRPPVYTGLQLTGSGTDCLGMLMASKDSPGWNSIQVVAATMRPPAPGS